MNRAVRQRGFTIIELMLAMAFISVLLLAIAMTVIQIGAIYNRGLTLKDVNQAARSINDELERGIASSTSFSATPGGGRYVQSAWGGRLCLGQYSYIWNYGLALSTGNPNNNRYTAASTAPISFVKVPDAGATYCAIPTQLINPTGAVELLTGGDHNLAIHSFAINSSATAGDALVGQRLYSVSFILGTNNINALVPDQSACKAPNVAGADLTYCVVQPFTIVLRGGSGVN